AARGAPGTIRPAGARWRPWLGGWCPPRPRASGTRPSWIWAPSFASRARGPAAPPAPSPPSARPESRAWLPRSPRRAGGAPCRNGCSSWGSSATGAGSWSASAPRRGSWPGSGSCRGWSSRPASPWAPTAWPGSSRGGWACPSGSWGGASATPIASPTASGGWSWGRAASGRPAPAGPRGRGARGLRGGVGLPVRVLGRRLRYTHRFSHRLWRVELWEVRLRQAGPGGPALPVGGGFAWVKAGRLAALPVAAAHRPAMELAAQEAADEDQEDEEPLQGEEARPQAPPVAGEADPQGEEAGAGAGHGDEEP